MTSLQRSYWHRADDMPRLESRKDTYDLINEIIKESDRFLDDTAACYFLPRFEAILEALERGIL